MGAQAGDQLVVNFASMAELSGNIQRAVATMDAQLGDLAKDAAPLVAEWAGDAQQAYQERQARWTNAANELKSILTAVKTAVDESTADYASTEKSNANLFT